MKSHSPLKYLACCLKQVGTLILKTHKNNEILALIIITTASLPDYYQGDRKQGILLSWPKYRIFVKCINSKKSCIRVGPRVYCF